MSDIEASRNFIDTPEARVAYIERSEASMRQYLESLSFEQKIASIERMRRASQLAREAMQAARENEKDAM